MAPFSQAREIGSLLHHCVRLLKSHEYHLVCCWFWWSLEGQKKWLPMVLLLPQFLRCWKRSWSFEKALPQLLHMDAIFKRCCTNSLKNKKIVFKCLHFYYTNQSLWRLKYILNYHWINYWHILVSKGLCKSGEIRWIDRQVKVERNMEKEDGSLRRQLNG